MQSTTVPTLQRFETGGVGVLPFIPQKARQQLTGANVQVLTPPDAPNCTGADLFYVGSQHTDNSIPPEKYALPHPLSFNLWFNLWLWSNGLT